MSPIAFLALRFGITVRFDSEDLVPGSHDYYLAAELALHVSILACLGFLGPQKFQIRVLALRHR